MRSSIVFSALLAVVLAALPIAAAPSTEAFVMQGCKPGTQRKISSKMINGSELAVYECDNDDSNAIATDVPARRVDGTLNACGVQCDTQCFGSAGNGPNQGDCNPVITAFDNAGDIYISNGKNTGFIYKSCAAYVFNGSGVDFTYCGSDAGAVTSYMANTCNGAHGYSAGNCYFQGIGHSMVQVTHS